ncbi:hypothetical protein ACQ5JZ_20020 [Streptomyces sp. ZG43]
MTSTATRPDLTHGLPAAVIGPVSLLGVALGFAAVPFVMILGLIGGAIAAWPRGSSPGGAACSA